MYERLEWRDGWLWVQSTPDGPWREASRERFVEWMSATLLPAAYDAGFRDSGDGWNGEYPDGAQATPYYADKRAKALSRLLPPA
jgi:hypothetical protein